MRFIYILGVLLFGFQNMSAQAKIDIQTTNYDKDFVTIGYYYGDRQLVLDTVRKGDDNQFVYQNEENLSDGVYLLLLAPSNKYIQFLVNKDEQQFSINLDTTDLGKPEITGSSDNQLFLDYISYLSIKGSENKALAEEIKNKTIAGEDASDLTKQRSAIDQEVRAYQRSILEEYSESITSKLISSTLEVDIPDFDGTEEEIKTQQYQYYRAHFFDRIDLGNPIFIRTPFLHNKIDSYINKLTPQSPDSLIVAIDYLLGKMEPAKETFQFYLSYFLNTYANSKVVGQDGIYVHLVDNYYAKGKADWVDDETLTKIVTEANKIRPTLIGKVAQDITVYRKDKTPISLSDIDTKYLILYFWAPDCGHCKKATPHVIDFYNKNKDSLDIEILAVCTKHRDKEPDCWDAVEEKGMDIWINASDVNHLSKFRSKYNVVQTPSIFILNEKREIIMKRIGAEYLDQVMQEIVRIDNLELIENQLNK
jgi:thiol-disulfide isomerase/thioredoxin